MFSSWLEEFFAALTPSERRHSEFAERAAERPRGEHERAHEQDHEPARRERSTTEHRHRD